MDDRDLIEGRLFREERQFWETYMSYVVANNFRISLHIPPDVGENGENGKKGELKFVCCYNAVTTGKEANHLVCPAHVLLEHTNTGDWIITKFNDSHDHDKQTGMESNLTFIAKDCKRQRITAPTPTNQQPERTMGIMEEYEKIRIAKWIDSLVEYKATLGPMHDHLCNMKMGSKGRAFAWLEPCSLDHIKDFSEVIYIDTSAEMIDHVPFFITMSVLVGCKKKLIGGACLEDGDGSLLQWCFGHWSKHLWNGKPKNVICAWGCIIDDAIAKGFNNPGRVFPTWKIDYEISKQLLPIVGRGCNGLQNEMKRARTAVSEQHFDSVWREICGYYNVLECPLMNYLYLHKKRWVLQLHIPVIFNTWEDWLSWDKGIVGGNIDPYMEFAEFLHAYKAMLK